METNNRRDCLNRLRLRSDDADNPYYIDDYMETNNRRDCLNRLRLQSDDGDDPYYIDDYMETRLNEVHIMNEDCDDLILTYFNIFHTVHAYFFDFKTFFM